MVATFFTFLYSLFAIMIYICDFKKFKIKCEILKYLKLIKWISIWFQFVKKILKDDFNREEIRF